MKQTGRGASGGGSIRQKTLNRAGKSYTYWEARYTAGYNPNTGRQIQRTITGKTKSEVAQKLRQKLVELDMGTYQEPCLLTVGEWLDIWMAEYNVHLKPRTAESYRCQIENHLRPELGKYKLDIVADRLGLVLSGTLHIVKEDFWGSRTIVGLARSGEVFAEAYACLGGEPLEVAVLAAADAEVLFLNSVQALSCARPGAAEFTRNLLTILAGRNLTLTRKIGHMARRTTRDKLLSYLSAQAMQAGGPEFDIPLDRQQLADYLAVDRSAMSTALGKLRDEGVLTFQKNHFHLLQQMEQTD